MTPQYPGLAVNDLCLVTEFVARGSTSQDCHLRSYLRGVGMFLKGYLSMDGVTEDSHK